MVVQKWVGARVGLMGNPSDGFGGKTIACLIRNFGAEVILRESRTLEIVRHPLFDPLTFSSLTHLNETAAHDGYYGGIRLLYATCNRLYEFCRERGISLDDRNFTLQYDTNIPRQVGLGGSSAIITATLKALMEFYGLTDRDIPKAEQPSLILSVETDELGIAAGLQDRVIQTYGGMVYMDFSPDRMQADGHGQYCDMDASDLPPLYLAYTSVPSESGKMHNIVRHRFHQGDQEVLDAVEAWAAYTDQARDALRRRDDRKLAALMDLNFDMRRRLYGDECLGPINLEMVRTARSIGLPAKFAGSGGAIVGCYEGEAQFREAKQRFEELGYSFTRIVPARYEEMDEPVSLNRVAAEV
ncbi:MAG: mevalonate kinase family protein [Armatimonadota bacterium]